jgi:hypothetical protein
MALERADSILVPEPSAWTGRAGVSHVSKDAFGAQEAIDLFLPIPEANRRRDESRIAHNCNPAGRSNHYCSFGFSGPLVRPSPAESNT